MTALKDRCHLALPDLDPSIALAQAARQDSERPALRAQYTAHQLIEQAKRERAQFIAALLRRFVARLRSTFLISTGQDCAHRLPNKAPKEAAHLSQVGPHPAAERS